ncbi:hypothetical protein CN918_26530 [Priestia megaterium]|nr:hypothetical protein CN918_26530 [Priestia megaterium]
MSTINRETFAAFFEHDIQPNYQEAVNEIIGMKRKQIIFIVVLAVAITAAFLILIMFLGAVLGILAGIGVTVVIYYFLTKLFDGQTQTGLTLSTLEERMEKVKTEVYNKILPEILPNFMYEYKGGLSPEIIERLGIFDTLSIDNVYTDDSLTGELNGRPLRLTEATVEQTQSRSDSDGNSSNTTVTIFRGLIAEMPIRDADGLYFHASQKSLLSGKKRELFSNRVKHEQAAPIDAGHWFFDDFYDLRANDPRLVHLNIQPRQWENLYQFIEEHKLYVHFSISNGTLFVFYECPNILEFFSKRTFSADRIWDDFQEIYKLLSFIETFDI